MTGIAAPNLPTYNLTAADVTSRNAEYTGTPLTDTDGSATYAAPYLGCNRAGSNAPGIGISTGAVLVPDGGVARPDNWTEDDQDGLARIPQDSDVIGNTGFVDRSSVAWPSSGGTEGAATNPINVVDRTDFNNTANLVIANTAAADGDEMDSASGAVNNTGAPVAVGDLVWGQVPVA